MWRAKELIYLGEMIDAGRAFEIGLVNRVLPADKLLEEVEVVAAQLATKPPFALAQAKRAIQKGFTLDLHTGSMLEREAFSVTFATEDQTEGMQAFLEKRKPSFKGK